MDLRLFARAFAVQGGAILLLFLLLLAAPLPEDFFRDWGAATGPAAWIVCSIVTWRVLSLPARTVAAAALGGGLAGAVILLLGSHGGAMVVALVAFAAACAINDAR